jgi:hypothetical protein
MQNHGRVLYWLALLILLLSALTLALLGHLVTSEIFVSYQPISLEISSSLRITATLHKNKSTIRYSAISKDIPTISKEMMSYL